MGEKDNLSFRMSSHTSLGKSLKAYLSELAPSSPTQSQSYLQLTILQLRVPLHDFSRSLHYVQIVQPVICINRDTQNLPALIRGKEIIISLSYKHTHTHSCFESGVRPLCYSCYLQTAERPWVPLTMLRGKFSSLSLAATHSDSAVYQERMCEEIRRIF